MPTKKSRLTKPLTGTLFQLKITLKDVKPAIWRRVVTRDCTLARLHDIIQLSMGWEDSHLHLFAIGGERFGLPDQWDPEFEGDEGAEDSRTVGLSHLVALGIRKFHYIYDMGDSWDHSVLIEQTVQAEGGIRYPRCTAGERACPPEDCGGSLSYSDFVEAVGGEFDSDALDLEKVNEELRDVR
jgi:Plasmid pRiA4b ORF-3-like protein